MEPTLYDTGYNTKRIFRAAVNEENIVELFGGVAEVGESLDHSEVRTDGVYFSVKGNGYNAIFLGAADAEKAAHEHQAEITMCNATEQFGNYPAPSKGSYEVHLHNAIFFGNSPQLFTVKQCKGKVLFPNRYTLICKGLFFTVFVIDPWANETADAIFPTYHEAREYLIAYNRTGYIVVNHIRKDNSQPTGFNAYSDTVVGFNEQRFSLEHCNCRVLTNSYEVICTKKNVELLFSLRKKYNVFFPIIFNEFITFRDVLKKHHLAFGTHHTMTYNGMAYHPIINADNCFDYSPEQQIYPTVNNGKNTFLVGSKTGFVIEFIGASEGITEIDDEVMVHTHGRFYSIDGLPSAPFFLSQDEAVQFAEKQITTRISPYESIADKQRYLDTCIRENIHIVEHDASKEISYPASNETGPFEVFLNTTGVSRSTTPSTFSIRKYDGKPLPKYGNHIVCNGTFFSVGLNNDLRDENTNAIFSSYAEAKGLLAHYGGTGWIAVNIIDRYNPGVVYAKRNNASALSDPFNDAQYIVSYRKPICKSDFRYLIAPDGNCLVQRPSEMTKAHVAPTLRTLFDMFPKVFAPEHLFADEATNNCLLQHKLVYDKKSIYSHLGITYVQLVNNELGTEHPKELHPKPFHNILRVANYLKHPIEIIGNTAMPTECADHSSVQTSGTYYTVSTGKHNAYFITLKSAQTFARDHGNPPVVSHNAIEELPTIKDILPGHFRVRLSEGVGRHAYEVTPTTDSTSNLYQSNIVCGGVFFTVFAKRNNIIFLFLFASYSLARKFLATFEESGSIVANVIRFDSQRNSYYAQYAFTLCLSESRYTFDERGNCILPRFEVVSPNERVNPFVRQLAAHFRLFTPISEYNENRQKEFFDSLGLRISKTRTIVFNNESYYHVSLKKKG